MLLSKGPDSFVVAWGVAPLQEVLDTPLRPILLADQLISNLLAWVGDLKVKKINKNPSFCKVFIQ